MSAKRLLVDQENAVSGGISDLTRDTMIKVWRSAC